MSSSMTSTGRVASDQVAPPSIGVAQVLVLGTLSRIVVIGHVLETSRPTPVVGHPEIEVPLPAQPMVETRAVSHRAEDQVWMTRLGRLPLSSVDSTASPSPARSRRSEGSAAAS